jgi:secondary thiamine-phosphate synthase enzyme
VKTFDSEILIDTGLSIEFVDITNGVRDACRESGIQNGMVTVVSSHTTGCVKITERCERLQKDMTAFLQKIVPESCYLHDEFTVDGRSNARMHIMALLMNCGETVPVFSGQPGLGVWQSIFFVELDGPRKGRKISIKVIGQ